MPYKKLVCLLHLVLSQVPLFALYCQPVLPPLQACVFITKREKTESEAQRGKPKGTLESEIRIAI